MHIDCQSKPDLHRIDFSRNIDDIHWSCGANRQRQGETQIGLERIAELLTLGTLQRGSIEGLEQVVQHTAIVLL